MNKELIRLQKLYNDKVAYRLKCTSTGSRKNYNLEDFEEEGRLIKMIYDLKNRL